MRAAEHDLQGTCSTMLSVPLASTLDPAFSHSMPWCRDVTIHLAAGMGQTSLKLVVA